MPVPGGLVADAGLWVADHSIGPFGVGAFVVRTRAHRPSLWELTDEESASLGPFLAAVSGAMVRALGAERVYLSMWVDAPPHHLHLVLEPRYRSEAAGPRGWDLQALRRQQGPPDATEAAAAAEKLRAAINAEHPRFAAGSAPQS